MLKYGKHLAMKLGEVNVYEPYPYQTQTIVLGGRLRKPRAPFFERLIGYSKVPLLLG